MDVIMGEKGTFLNFKLVFLTSHETLCSVIHLGMV